MVLERDADDAVEQPTEMVLAHVRDRCDLGEREPPIAVDAHVGQRALNGGVRRRYPELWMGVCRSWTFRNLGGHEPHVS
jgi:hypothetical protein